MFHVTLRCSHNEAQKRRGRPPLRGWGTGIRTPIGRSRVGSPTVERYPIRTRPMFVRESYDTLTFASCQAPVLDVFSCEGKRSSTNQKFCSAKFLIGAASLPLTI